MNKQLMPWLLISLFALVPLQAQTLQWERTNGPYGFQPRPVRCLAINGKIIFAGTSGAGVYRSEDNGDTWTQLDSGVATDANCSFLATNDTALFVGMNYGSSLWRSLSNGDAWMQVSKPDTAKWWSSFTVKGSEIFAGTDKGVFRSTGNGDWWQYANSGLPFPNTNAQVLAVCGNTIFASMNNGGAYRSTDDGVTWISSGLSGRSISSFAGNGIVVFAAANYPDRLYRSTNNGSSWDTILRIQVGPLLLNNATLFAGINDSNGFTLSRSTNNGNTWVPVLGRFGVLYALTGTGSSIFAATDSGVFRSTDGGATWVPLAIGVKDRAVGELLTNRGSLFATTSDWDLWRSLNKGESWIQVQNGLIGKVVSSVVRGSEIFTSTDSGLFRSTNNGNSWSKVYSGVTLRLLTCSGTGLPLFACSSQDTVYRSTDGGASWTVCPRSPHAMWCLAANETAVFAGTDNDGVYRSTNNGDSWTQVDNSFIDPIGLVNGDVYAITTNGQTIFAGTWYGDIHRSTDNGETWYQAGGGLPGMYALFPNGPSVHGIAMSGNTIFVGTTLGVYLSTNNGNTWMYAGLPNSVSWRSLVIDGSTLFAGTGGGVYRVDISELQSGVNDQHTASQSLSLTIQPNPARDELRANYNSANAEIELSDLLGERVMSASGNENGVMKFDVSALPAGMYMMRLRSGAATATQVVMIVR